MCKLKVILKENGMLKCDFIRDFHNLDLNVFAIPYFVVFDKYPEKSKFTFEFLESKSDTKQEFKTLNDNCVIEYSAQLKRVYAITIIGIDWTIAKWDSLISRFKNEVKSSDLSKFLRIAKAINCANIASLN